MRFSAFVFLMSPVAISAFSPPAKACMNRGVVLAADPMSLADTAPNSIENDTNESSTSIDSINDSLTIPLTYTEMIQQVSQAMSDAYQTRGMTRQIVRILLPRDATSGQIGEYYEVDAEVANKRSRLGMGGEVKLVPNDESWQGGIMQLYRSASPTTKDILRQLSPTAAATGVPPKIIEDRAIDESGVDGVGLLYTQMGGENDNGNGNNDNNDNGFFGSSLTLPKLSENDMCVFVQPTQEVVDVIEKLSKSSEATDASPQSPLSPLIALLNPQWRNVDDALDTASKSDNLFGAFASFLGGKGSSLRTLDSLGYVPTYTLEGYVCKGGNVRLIQRFDSDWIVFAENDDGDDYIRVGMMKKEEGRPTYQDVERMLEEKGVGYKYARDLGMAPKL